jgi:hypothetical protein
LVFRRTAVINQIRAFLLERGMVFAQKPAKLKAAMADILENAEANLTLMMRNLVNMLWSEWKLVEQQIEEPPILSQAKSQETSCSDPLASIVSAGISNRFMTTALQEAPAIRWHEGRLVDRYSLIFADNRRNELRRCSTARRAGRSVL